MKLIFTLVVAALCNLFSINAQAQLVADAGPDKVWCQNWNGSSTDTPVFGGNIVASGGVPPYTYKWQYREGATVYGTGWYLDKDTIQHPRMTREPQMDSAYAIVSVRDANGAEVKDSTIIYHQTIGCSLGIRTFYKRSQDTIIISGGSCSDNFPPYHDYLWQPVTGLMDSTIAAPRCFTAVSKTYTLYKTDRIGCRFVDSRPEVITTNVGIAATPMYAVAPQVFQSYYQTITIKTPMNTNSSFVLYDISGRRVMDQRLESGVTNITLPNIPVTMYFYRITNDEGAVFSGRLNIQ